MDMLKIVETEVKITQFTWLKQAGREIENGPCCVDNDGVNSRPSNMNASVN